MINIKMKLTDVCLILVLIYYTSGCSLPDFCAENENLLELGPKSLYTECNVAIPANELSRPPLVQLRDAIEYSMYLLIVVDPDAGQAADVLHWMITDIKGSSLRTGHVDDGESVIQISYEGPNPPGAEKHRYQFLLYEQPTGGIDASSKRRIRFNLEHFLTRNNLCDTVPVASFQYKSFQ